MPLVSFYPAESKLSTGVCEQMRMQSSPPASNSESRQPPTTRCLSLQCWRGAAPAPLLLDSPSRQLAGLKLQTLEEEGASAARHLPPRLTEGFVATALPLSRFGPCSLVSLPLPAPDSISLTPPPAPPRPPRARAGQSLFSRKGHDLHPAGSSLERLGCSRSLGQTPNQPRAMSGLQNSCRA